MIVVSDAWKAVQKETVLPESFVEVTYWITDPDAQASATESNNGVTFYSNPGVILDTNYEDFRKYATLEQNMWVLDGSLEILSDNHMFLRTGYVADAEYPMVTITFPNVRTQSVPGITIVWSEAYGEYATRCRITALNGTEIVVSGEFQNDSVRSFFDLPMSGYDRIYIEIIEWFVPDHRPRIEKFYLGAFETYTKAELTKFSHTQSADLLSTELPKNEVVFSLDNSSGIWNPDDPTSKARYLTDRQSVSVRYGYKLPNDEDEGEPFRVEWIPAGTFWLSEWDTPANGLEVTFTARDLLGLQDIPYTGTRKGTLYRIASQAIAEAQEALSAVPNVDTYFGFSIDESLSELSIDFSNNTEPYTVAVVLQMVANAGQCVMYQDRNGVFRIERHKRELSDYVIGQDVSYTHPERTLSKPPREVNVNNGLAVETIASTGETIAISNPLITSAGNAAQVGSWAAGVLRHRNFIRGSYRPDPRLDVLDIVSVESKYSQNFVAAVTEIKYEYNGAFRGEYVAREIEV